VQLGQSFARIRDGQVFLMGCHIEEYVEGESAPITIRRGTRRMLLHRGRYGRLYPAVAEGIGGGQGGGQRRWPGKGGGATLIPLEMYFRRGYVKVFAGNSQGKASFDKRQSIKEREDQRNMQKALRRG